MIPDRKALEDAIAAWQPWREMLQDGAPGCHLAVLLAAARAQLDTEAKERCRCGTPDTNSIGRCSRCQKQVRSTKHIGLYDWLRTHSFVVGAGKISFGAGITQSQPEVLDAAIAKAASYGHEPVALRAQLAVVGDGGRPQMMVCVNCGGLAARDQQLDMRAAACVKALDGLPQDALDGGWTAAGICAYAKKLETELAALRANSGAVVAWEPATIDPAYGYMPGSTLVPYVNRFGEMRYVPEDRASSRCPVCGVNKPHEHTSQQLEILREKARLIESHLGLRAIPDSGAVVEIPREAVRCEGVDMRCGEQCSYAVGHVGEHTSLSNMEIVPLAATKASRAEGEG